MIHSQLLKKYFLKQCTSEEEALVRLWLRENAEDDQLQKLMHQDWQSAASDPVDTDYESHYDQILEKIGENEKPEIKKTNPSRRLYFNIAASIAFLVMAVLSFIYFKPIMDEEWTADIRVPPVLKQTTKGQKLTTYLADGTKVKLNGESSLQIHDFDDSVRRISLEGEAFFEVAHDASKPFVVEVNELETVVLGTSFNVKSRPDEKVIVSLLSGSVKVSLKNSSKTVRLNPGQEIIFEKENGQLVTTEFSYNQRIGWKDGVLHFEEASVMELRELLENWYGVNIHLINAPQTDWEFSGTFKNESLENVLEGIKYMKGINYQIKDEQVEISFN